MPHRNAYEQDSTPYAGPTSASKLTASHVTVPTGALAFLQFSPKYADGQRAAWFSMVSNPDAERVGKIDVKTGRLIDLYDQPLPGNATPSGAYNVLDHAGRMIVGKGTAVSVYQDATAGDRFSKVAKTHTFQLPDSALCGPDDHMVGIILTWDGQVAFATQYGSIGVFPDDPAKMDAAHVKSVTVTPRSTCTAGNAAREEISNSIGADEHGAIYTVTSAAQYKHVWNGTSIRQAWRVKIASDGLQGGVRIGPGSGSSPTLMGTAKKRRQARRRDRRAQGHAPRRDVARRHPEGLEGDPPRRRPAHRLRHPGELRQPEHRQGAVRAVGRASAATPRSSSTTR